MMITSTFYRYEPHHFGVPLRANSSQPLLSFELKSTSKPAGTIECLDRDGNLTWNDSVCVQAGYGA
jgi:hypothetical protein